MKRQIKSSLLAAFALICICGALAWSSKNFPPCEPVHQVAIQDVLSNQISPDQINILKEEQTVVDQDQQPTNSFEHSMTGIEKAGETTNIESPIYVLEAEAFIHSNLTYAIQARQAGQTSNAFVYLGKAIHPLEDATSPSHKPFQAWKYNEGLWEEIRHVLNERSYPDNANDTNQVEERIELDGSVQYAYDIFIGKVKMPVQFFDHTNGLLELPAEYLMRHK